MAPTNSEQLDELSEKVDTILNQLAILTTTPFPPPPPPPNPPHPCIKLDVPRFDGTYTMGWIFKIN